MRINNVNSKTSSQALVVFIVLTLVTTIGYLLTFWFMAYDHSLIGFFEWIKSSFSYIWADDIMVALIFAGFPVLAYVGLISTFIARNKALQDFATTLNIKYVDFLYDRVNFVFNQPQYNIICGYNEINSLRMVLHTVMVRNKYGSFPAVQEIELKFVILNKREFKLKNIPLNLMKFIYSVIDYGRRMENFSYEFEGVGEVEDVKEKIDDYLNKGFKQILATGMENAFKSMSIIFFAFGIFFMLMFMDMFQTDAWFISAVPSFAFIGISFIFDIFLLADKMRERKYKV